MTMPAGNFLPDERLRLAAPGNYYTCPPTLSSTTGFFRCTASLTSRNSMDFYKAILDRAGMTLAILILKGDGS